MNYNMNTIAITNTNDTNTIMSNIDKLPDEIVRKIMLYRPRNDTASIIVNANKQDKFRLNYVNKDNSVEEVWNNLRPLKLGSNTYGDDEAPMHLIRANITLGEKKRIRLASNLKQ